MTELDEFEWKMMNINLKFALLISKHTIPLIVSTKNGKIVLVSSRTGLKSDGYDSAYSASKSGLIWLVESISEEVKEHCCININCILPSIIDTETNRKAMPNSDFSKWVKPLLTKMRAQRVPREKHSKDRLNNQWHRMKK